MPRSTKTSRIESATRTGPPAPGTATGVAAAPAGAAFTAPDLTVPEVTTPEVTTSEVTASGVTASEITAAEITAPEVTPSGVSAPEAPDPGVGSAEVPDSEGRSPETRAARLQPAGAAASARGAADRYPDLAEPDFLAAQRAALLAERATYLGQAEELKAQADSLALEHEPGDVQFDEEGGEGGTSNVDRELDLLLSAQARGAVEEIDRALAKMDAGTYGRCEQCGKPIPEARLEALPHAALCVVCKAGGLASRR